MNRILSFLKHNNIQIEAGHYTHRHTYIWDDIHSAESDILTFPLRTRHRSASLLRQPNPFIEDPVKYSRPTANKKKKKSQQKVKAECDCVFHMSSYHFLEVHFKHFQGTTAKAFYTHNAFVISYKVKIKVYRVPLYQQQLLDVVTFSFLFFFFF